MSKSEKKLVVRDKELPFLFETLTQIHQPDILAYTQVNVRVVDCRGCPVNNCPDKTSPGSNKCKIQQNINQRRRQKRN